MQGLKDLFSSEKGLIALALIASATVLVGIGKMTVDQWKDFSTYIFGFYASAKAVTTVGMAIANRGSTDATTPGTTTTTTQAPPPAPSTTDSSTATASIAPTAPAPATPGTLATAASKATTVLAIALLGGLVFGNSGCTKNARIETIQASLAVASATEATFHAYEKQHELDLVKSAASRADADAALLRFYSKRTKFNAAMDALFAAIATAAVVNDDQSLAAIATAAKNLNDVVKDIETIDGKAGTP